ARVASGTRSMRPASVAARWRTGASANGRTPASLSSSGGGGCSPTTSERGSTGSGWLPMARWPNPPLGGERSGPHPTGRAERGVKRSLLCEGAGVPIGLEVAGANIRDEKLLRATIDSIPIRLLDNAELDCGVCLDKGYDCSEVYELLDEFGFTAHVR